MTFCSGTRTFHHLLGSEVKTRANYRHWNLLKDSEYRKITIRFAHSHISTNTGVEMERRNQINPLIEFQRNIYEIPFMETNSLCMAMKESSKSGYFKEHVWKKYISRAIDLKHKLGIKNISIIMISSAKANVKDRDFYEQMCDRVITKCKLYIGNDRDTSEKNLENGIKSEFSAFNIFSILTACDLVQYRDDELYKNLWQVTRRRLEFFMNSVDLLLEKHNMHDSDGVSSINRDNRFTFEDIAGILNAYASASIVIPDMLEIFERVFKKLYTLTCDVDSKYFGKIPYITEINPKTFSITIHSLVRLGCTSFDIFNIGLSYMLTNLDKMVHMRDMTMVFASIVKLRCIESHIGSQFTSDRELIKLIDYILEKFKNTVFDSNCISSLSSTMIALLNYNIFPQGSVEHYRSSFNTIFLNSIRYLVTEEDISDKKILVQILKNSTILQCKQAALLLLSDSGIKQIGLVSSPFDVSQYFFYLSDIYSSNSGRIASFIESHAMMAIKQYTQRLTYVLSPNLLGLSKTPSKPPDLYTMLKLEAKKKSESDESEEVNIDWKCINKDIMEYTIDNFNTLATILGSCTKFRPSKHVSNFVNIALNYLLKLFKYNNSHFDVITVEAISAVVYTFSKFRLKNRDFMQQIANIVITSHNSMGSKRTSSNLMAMNNIMMSFAKLDFPKNPLFNFKLAHMNRCHIDIPVIYKIKRIVRLSNDDLVFFNMFKSFSKLLNTENINKMNSQMVTNCLYTYSLVGFDKVSKVKLVKLLKRLIYLRKECSKFPPSTNNSSVKDHGEFKLLRNLLPDGNFIEKGNSIFKEENIAYGQIRIISLALENFIKHINGTRAIEKYSKQIKKSYTPTLSREFCEIGSRGRKYANYIAGSRQDVRVRPSISGFHRNVLYILSKLNKDNLIIKSEVPVKNRAYFMDISVQRNKSIKYIEVNGPYHYYSQTQNLTSVSKMKYFLISSHCRRVIKLPYYEWVKCENEEDKIKYLYNRINNRL
ncbi:hypothetical protein BEWA_034420 [Theileria equi strain WA]|uniref:RAP domain-containing protein n=1 Tax=Theileria equi strain WA TaxID=1537102 RepID=L0B0C1_THEEQ|nr:hypothetical protein BEWA_034420 [Theileria equi strain WA]AFZ80584.1 hypothetical protein BEWA_034420 [Theileria equi strain WA]|eukprot:XP_004830250.1 hypothetical protein BEWA_034420 [Theileria equi strain WA]